LTGADDIAHTKCDVIVDTLQDIAQAYYQKVFSVPKEQQPEATKKFFSEDVPKHLANVEKLVGLYGSNGHSVGNSVTWADLYLQDVTHMLHLKDAHVLDKFPHVAKVKQTVESHPKVAAWLKARPENAF
jgi:glutathione S-transferase